MTVIAKTVQMSRLQGIRTRKELQQLADVKSQRLDAEQELDKANSAVSEAQQRLIQKSKKLREGQMQKQRMYPQQILDAMADIVNGGEQLEGLKKERRKAEEMLERATAAIDVQRKKWLAQQQREERWSDEKDRLIKLQRVEREDLEEDDLTEDRATQLFAHGRKQPS